MVWAPVVDLVFFLVWGMCQSVYWSFFGMVLVLGYFTSLFLFLGCIRVGMVSVNFFCFRSWLFFHGGRFAVYGFLYTVSVLTMVGWR